MLKVYLLTLLAGFISSFPLKSQFFKTNEIVSVREFKTYQSPMGNTRSSGGTQYAQVKGSPYLKQEFIKSEALSLDSIRYVNAKFRFNIYSDQIEYMIDETIYILTNPLDFRFFVLGEEVFIYQVYNDENNTLKRGYFQLLATGNLATLAKRLGMNFIPPREQQSYAAAIPARFARKSDTYYIRFHGNLPEEVPMNRKRVLEIFPDKTKELEKFISDNRLNFRNENDLVKLVEFYNTL